MKSKMLLVLLSITFFVNLEAQDVQNGKNLFKTNCASCHKVDKKLVGPALQGVTESRDKEWIYKWVKNNIEFRASGDPDAIAIFEEFNGSLMNAFPSLTNQEIDDIFAYVDSESANKEAKSTVASTGVSGEGSQEGSGVVQDTLVTVLSVVILVMLLFIVIVLNELRNALNKNKGVVGHENIFASAKKLLCYFLRKKGFMGVLIALVILGGTRSLWNGILSVGVDQGYKPIQPIEFSHKIHAGDQKIDCNYCHSSARQSKVSGIPSANVCMNCHKFIQEGTNTGTKEISKIYKAIGFDPENQSYIPNYVEQPIKWVKIHDLQDFVYFNHSQHVVTGGVACQTCHGPVETMDEVYQFAPLTMGWCIECHRTTKVKTEGNEYYEKIHKQLAKKYGTESLTVSMMGGLECGKCHY